MTDDLGAVLAAARETVGPDPEERDRLEAAARAVVERAREAVADLPVEADVVQVGSTARHTWTSGDRDIDVFVRFPPSLDREQLEQYGLEVGHRVVPDGREEYAEHPYVTGEYDGFRVDLVPCYGVRDATAIRSAVDRTPFHDAYLGEQLDEDLAADVRLLKGFLKGIGAYGSDLRTRGFSGYLAELLVLEYGGFRSLVQAAADWRPPVRLDPDDTGSDATFDHPLVVVDPTDPDRNVAAVLSTTNLARFQHYARELLADPREALFEPRAPDPLSPAAVREHVRRRGTTPIALRFQAPDVVDDQLYPQLRRTLAGIVAELERRGFQVLRSTTFAGDDAVLLVELSVAELPAVVRHEGPPVAVRDHAEGFFEKYADTEDGNGRSGADGDPAVRGATRDEPGDAGVYGPFVDGDRYVVEREREFTRARALLAGEALFEVGIGPDVEDALRAGREVLVGEDTAGLADEFGVELARYFDPRP